jgi:hypothetical protein
MRNKRIKPVLFAWKRINIRFIFAYIRFEPNIAVTLLSLLFVIVLPLFFTSFPSLSLSRVFSPCVHQCIPPVCPSTGSLVAPAMRKSTCNTTKSSFTQAAKHVRSMPQKSNLNSLHTTYPPPPPPSPFPIPLPP